MELQLETALLPGKGEQPQSKPPRLASERGGEGASQVEQKLLGD